LNTACCCCCCQEFETVSVLTALFSTQRLMLQKKEAKTFFSFIHFLHWMQKKKVFNRINDVFFPFPLKKNRMKANFEFPAKCIHVYWKFVFIFAATVCRFSIELVWFFELKHSNRFFNCSNSKHSFAVFQLCSITKNLLIVKNSFSCKCLSLILFWNSWTRN